MKNQSYSSAKAQYSRQKGQSNQYGARKPQYRGGKSLNKDLIKEEFDTVSINRAFAYGDYEDKKEAEKKLFKRLKEKAKLTYKEYLSVKAKYNREIKGTENTFKRFEDVLGQVKAGKINIKDGLGYAQAMINILERRIKMLHEDAIKRQNPELEKEPAKTEQKATEENKNETPSTKPSILDKIKKALKPQKGSKKTSSSTQSTAGRRRELQQTSAVTSVQKTSSKSSKSKAQKTNPFDIEGVFGPRR